MRRAIQTAESVAPAILWIDEIDKAFAGTQGSAGSDGGTASRVFGTFLTWLSEKTAPVFVIATANDISHLPPELLRKGRVDEIFFVDLPNEDERREIFRIHLAEAEARPGRVRPRRAGPAERRASAAPRSRRRSSPGCTTPSAADTRPRHGRSCRRAWPRPCRSRETMSEELNRLRTWAQGRARPASGAIAPSAPEVRRKIEL